MGISLRQQGKPSAITATSRRLVRVDELRDPQTLGPPAASGVSIVSWITAIPGPVWISPDWLFRPS
jgi:hypothetical protein